MAKLSFDVSAKWQEVQKLREEVEALKAVLKDFNVAGDLKGFDELNKKYQESTQKLKEYEQQVQNYQRIIDQLNVSNGVVEGARMMTSELNNATDVFVEQQLKVKALNEDIKKLNKSYFALSDIDKRGQKGANILTELKEITHQYTIENEALKKLRKEYSDNIKIEGAAADSLVALRKQLSLLNAEYDRLSASDRKAAIGTDLQKQIQSLNTEISAAEQATGRYQRNVGNYASAWNGLGMSVQQVARELPSLAISWNTFFLAISNNLPILVDELKKASAQYKAFKAAVAAGNNDVAKVAPVWKQLISSVFSWQTALVVAITLLSVYGKDVIEWTKSLFGADVAQQRLNDSLKEFNAIAEKSQLEAKLLFDTVKKTEEGTQGRVKAINEINKAYGEYLPYLISEKASLEELEKAYKKVTGALRENAAEKAKQKAIDDIVKDSTEKQAEALYDMRSILEERVKGKGDDFFNSIIDEIKNLTDTFKEEGHSIDETVRGIFDKIRYETDNADLGRGFANAVIDFVDSFYKANEDIEKVNKKYNPFFNKEQAEEGVVYNKKYWERIKKQAESAKDSIASYALDKLEKGVTTGISEETIEKYNKAQEAIKKATKELKVYDSYDKKSQAAEKKAKEALRAAEKERKEQEKLNALLLELQFKNQQSQINLMEEGTDKKLAQIDLDYDKQIAEIRKKEKELRDKNKGVLSEQDTKTIQQMYVEAYVVKMRSDQKVEKDQAKAEKEAMNKYLIEYGSYQEKRLAIKEKYDRLIAKAGTEGERLSLWKQATKELSDLEIKYSKTTNAIIALFGDMRDKSLKELIELSDRGSKALTFLKSKEWDEQKGKDLGITKEQFELWQSFSDVIDNAGKSLTSIKDKVETLQPAFDKVTQGLKRFLAAGDDPKKLKESLQLINEGVNEVMSSVQFLSDTFGKLGDSFGGVFSGIADGLNIAMDAVNSAMQGAQAGAMFGPIGAAAGAAIGVVTSLASAIAKIHDKKNEKRIQKLQDQIDVLDASYEKLGRSIEKAYSTSAAQLISQQDELLKQQKILIQQQIKEEQDKKKLTTTE